MRVAVFVVLLVAQTSVCLGQTATKCVKQQDRNCQEEFGQRPVPKQCSSIECYQPDYCFNPCEEDPNYYTWLNPIAQAFWNGTTHESWIETTLAGGGRLMEKSPLSGYQCAVGGKCKSICDYDPVTGLGVCINDASTPQYDIRPTLYWNDQGPCPGPGEGGPIE